MSQVVPISPTTSQNARIGSIRKFVARPPERGVRLVLKTTGATPLVLGEWMRAGCEDSSSVPVDVDDALKEQAQVTRTRVQAALEWLDDDGERVTQKTVTHPAIIEPGATQTGDEYDARGTATSEVEATNRMLARELLSMIRGQGTATNSIIAMQNSTIERLTEANHAKDLEYEKLRIAHRRELERLEASDPAPEADGRTELFTLAGQALSSALPAILQGLLAGPAGPAIAALFGAGSQPQQAPAPQPPKLPPRPATPPPLPGDKPAPAPAPAPEPAEPGDDQDDDQDDDEASCSTV